MGSTSLESLIETVANKCRLKPKQQELLLRCAILAMIWTLAFAVRLVCGALEWGIQREI